MYHALLLLLSLFLLACSHSRPKMPEERRTTLKAPINQKIIGSDFQTFRKQKVCKNKCSTTEFSRTMNKLGFVRTPVRNLQQILRSLDEGVTVVFYDGGEFFEIYGKELRDEVLFALDKNRAPRRFGFKNFMSKWEGGGYWAKSFLPPQQLRDENIPKDIVSQAHAMEKNTPKKAIKLYRRLMELALHPEISYHSVHRIDSTTPKKDLLRVYEAGLNNHPNEKAVWNGYVRLLKQTGKRQEAHKVENKVSKMFGWSGQRLL